MPLSDVTSAVTNLGTAALNKSAQDKATKANLQVAQEGTKQAQTAVQVAQINAKQQSKDTKAQTSQSIMMYWAIGAVVLVIIGIVVYVKVIRK